MELAFLTLFLVGLCILVITPLFFFDKKTKIPPSHIKNKEDLKIGMTIKTFGDGWEYENEVYTISDISKFGFTATNNSLRTIYLPWKSLTNPHHLMGNKFIEKIDTNNK